MRTPALRVPCSAEPRLLPSRAKEQLLRGALRPPRLLSRSVWAAATGSTPGGLTGSRRVSAAFPGGWQAEGGAPTDAGSGENLPPGSQIASSHCVLAWREGRAAPGSLCKDTNPTVGLRPGDLATCQRPRLPHLAAFGGHSRQSPGIRPPGPPAPTGGAAADQDTRSSCAPLSGLLLCFLLPSPTLVPCLCHQFLFVSPYS